MSRTATAAGLIATALALGCQPPASSPDAGRESDIAVAYQIDIAHTGNQPDSPLKPPLTQAWAVDFDSPTSYPLIVGDMVYVTHFFPDPSREPLLTALDLATGAVRWGPFGLGGQVQWSNACYDAGRIYTVSESGDVRAFDARTGMRLWSQKFGTYGGVSSPPTASAGRVFFASSDTGMLYALDGATGDVLWKQPVLNGDNSAPAVSSVGVYVSYSCNNAHAFDPLLGTKLWLHQGECSGGGGKTAALHAGSLYIRDAPDGNLVLDAATGKEKGTFSAGPIPAFLGKQAFYLQEGTLSAVDLATGNTTWTFTGDGTLVTAPIVVNGYVYIGGTSGLLYALKPDTGASVWSTDVGRPLSGPDEQNAAQGLTGLASGGATLVVPAGMRLIAYR
jgi:outer membrane protein assembly factor BamB